MPAKSFDVAVLGLGTMGSLACLELARRGLSVIGLDRYAPPHGYGSHSGATRVFRVAYAEHPDYVPLAQRAGVLWDRLGAEAGTVFLHRCGMLSLGPEDSALIAGARASAAAHGLCLEELSPAELRVRFPVFTPPPGWNGLFEPAAGWIDVDAALRFSLEQAERAGAVLRLNTKVERWEQRRGDFVVVASTGEWIARRLIIVAGAWAGQILADLHLPLKVLRKWLIWVNPLHPELFQPGVFPVFASADKFFYGFPDIHGAGVKLAIHWSEQAPAANPDQEQAEPASDEIQPVLEAAAALLPSLGSAVIRRTPCLYTMTPDEHFLVDRHPTLENLYFAAGFSGHGFKFAPVVGEALADLAIAGRTELPVGFLCVDRPGLRIPRP